MSVVRAPVELAWAGLPCLGQRLSGDLVLVDEGAVALCAVVVDVAGHGPEAYAAAQSIGASRPLAAPLPDASVAVRRIHDGLSGSGRIAAAMAVRVLAEGESVSLEYCGVGNVRLAVSGTAYRDQGSPGMAGQHLPSLRLRSLPIKAPCLVAVFTDGLASGVALGPDLERVALPLLPSLLLHRYGRRHDDATCLVLRLGGRPG